MDVVRRETPRLRWNPLRREWVLVSPRRTTRPWQGQVERTADAHGPAHDPMCYLCPRTGRAGGVANPDYRSTFVFDNDFPALLPTTAAGEEHDGELLVARAERGRCRVVCFSPRHDVTCRACTTVIARQPTSGKLTGGATPG